MGTSHCSAWHSPPGVHSETGARVTAMYRGICVCVLLAVLSMSSSGQQTARSNYGDQVAAEIEKSLTDHHRPVRMPSSSGQLKPFLRMDRSIDQKANYQALMAKYLQQRKVSDVAQLVGQANVFVAKFAESSVGISALPLFKKGGPSGRYAIVQNRPIIDPTHRINDRDYMGWMDFGRRSAEEYEYSS